MPAETTAVTALSMAASILLDPRDMTTMAGSCAFPATQSSAETMLDVLEEPSHPIARTAYTDLLISKRHASAEQVGQLPDVTGH